MAAEDTPVEGVPHHRPLPSVEMPLLREHRRAIRVKQLAVVGGAVLLVGGGVTAAIFLRPSGDAAGASHDRPPAAGAPTAIAVSEEGSLDRAEDEDEAESDGDEEAAPAPDPTDTTPVTVGAATRVARAFGRARGFRDALVRAGASPEECDELERALDGVLDFRRCRPEDRLVFERDAGGHLLLFEHHGSSTEYVRASRGPAGTLRGERVQIPVDVTRVARGGRIRTSLGAAFEQAGLGRALVGRFTEVFEGKANFVVDARVGDAFRIIAEEERIDGHFHRWGTVHAVQYTGQRTGELQAYYHATDGDDDEGEFYDETGRSVHGGWLRTPLRYDRISSRFDLRRMHPILRRIVPHNGVDYAAGTGTPVWAAASGEVTFAGERGANGNLVAIRHADGYETFYAHLHRFERGIRSGVRVERRQLIGYVGSTGRSTGPHLHFGLKRGGRFIDPLPVINGPGRMMSAGHLPRFRTRAQRLSAELSRIDVGEGPAPRESARPAEVEHREEPMD
jgi:murein DD-endopeptidase MepM/ murein hydrolase activator NlpD